MVGPDDILTTPLLPDGSFTPRAFSLRNRTPVLR
jgi:hypothetical protein